jgi:hypothetical protein
MGCAYSSSVINKISVYNVSLETQTTWRDILKIDLLIVNWMVI